MKNSKELSKVARQMLWSFYKEDNKGFKTFEGYCKPIADKKKQILAILK